MKDKMKDIQTYRVIISFNLFFYCYCNIKINIPSINIPIDFDKVANEVQNFIIAPKSLATTVSQFISLILCCDLHQLFYINYIIY